MEITIGAALISTALRPLVDLAMEKATAMVVGNVGGIDKIKRDISNLQTTLSMIQDIVQVAEVKQIDDDLIRNCLRDLVDIGYEARDVLDDFITFSSCTMTAEEAKKPVNFISSFMLSCVGGSSSYTSKPSLANQNQLAKNIRSVRERFDEKKESETFAILKSAVAGGSENVPVDLRLEVGPYLNQQADNPFLGRKEEKEGIIEKILHPSDDNRVHVVVIWGMPGIGKTTLAQSIYNDERVKKVPRRWLSVGVNKFSAEKVIKEIVNDKKTIDIGNLQIKLQKKLRGHRFLIVLDDAFDVDGSEWNLLFNPLTEVGKGGLIIITRRERQLCDEITIQTTYNLEPLSEEDSWSIFESYAYINGKSDSTSDLKCIGKKIVKKLKGLPLTLKVVGRSLLDKDSSTWTNFLESSEWKLQKDVVMFTLRWSYNHLPQHLKKCFTNCALFPKDHVLDKKVLVQMWMAHDLIQRERQKRPEDVGAQYFEELVNASLLQCVDGKYVMHDLIHDLALLVSNEKFATADDSLSIGQMDKVRHITIKHVDYLKIPRLCKIKKLLTLYTISSDEKYTKCRGVLDDVFKQLKSIRVLVLSSEWINEIPNCISELRYLRYLDVSETRVKSLPDSLRDLYNLQMLAAPLDAILPRNIVNMVNLRYIRANLSTCKGVRKLTSLQELSSIHICEGDNIRELGDMQRLRGKLTIKDLENVEKLEDDVAALMEKQTLMDELELLFDKQLEKSTISAQVLDALGCPPNLKCLKISGYNGVKSPSWMVDGNHKFDELQILELNDCHKLESLPPLGELTSLKHLSLLKVGVKRLGDEFYGEFTDGKVFFPFLESLRFHEMQEWEWDDIIIKNSSVPFFPRLTTLEIKECAKLVSVLPVVKNPNFMTSLSSLKIWKCDGLERLQLDALVSIKELDISDCRSLVKITSAICLVTTIERLRISSCTLLEKMDFERLPSLEHLDVSCCNELISIPSLVVIRFLKLDECKSLRSLNINIHGLDSLEHLHINGCPTLELAFEDGSSSSSSSGNSVHDKMKIFTRFLQELAFKDGSSSSSSSGNSVAVPIHNISTDNTQVFRTFLHHEIISLESLGITKLEGFANFDETEANNFCKSRLLKSLHISQCKDLNSLPPDFHKLLSLKSLSINDCPQLQSLPPDFHKLSSLEKLKIKSCPQLQSLPPDFHNLSSLKDLIIIDCLQLQSLPPDFHMLSSLERLNILSCPQLQSLPADFHKLSSLQSLCIEYCPQLQSLPADGSPPFLRDLTIEGCPLLYERCKDGSGLDWHKIKHIRWKRITNLAL